MAQASGSSGRGGDSGLLLTSAQRSLFANLFRLTRGEVEAVAAVFIDVGRRMGMQDLFSCYDEMERYHVSGMEQEGRGAGEQGAVRGAGSERARDVTIQSKAPSKRDLYLIPMPALTAHALLTLPHPLFPPPSGPV